jgi:hypothetical protein
MLKFENGYILVLFSYHKNIFQEITKSKLIKALKIFV